MKKYTIKQIREERIAISKLTEEQFNKLVEAFQKKYPNDNYKHSYIKEAEQWRFYSNLCAPLDVVGRFTYVSYVSDIASSFIRASKLITFEEIDFEEFPEKWAVKNDIDKIVGKWFDENKQNSIQDYALKYTNKYFHYPAIREKEYILDNEYFHAFTEVQKGYTEITLEEFKKHILKEETMEEKKIIGYKLVKPEYKEAVIKIVKNYFHNGIDLIDYIEKHGFNSDPVINLKEAGVLDLWFEPIFKEEYKVNDWVVVSNGNVGWCSDAKNIIGQVTNIDKHSNFSYRVSSEMIRKYHKNYNYAWFKTIRKATKEEIEEYNKPKLPVINGYSARVEGDYIIYGSNCAKFHKDFFLSLYKTWIERDWNQNRTIGFIKLDSGVEINMEQIKQIVGYINKN